MNDPWEDIHSYVDVEMAKLMSHPVRAKILAVTNERIISPSRFSERYGEPLHIVIYHFRVLRESGCIEVVGEKTKGNMREAFYRATRRALFDGKAWEDLPETVRNKLSGRTFSDCIETVAEAMLAETFDARLDRALAWEKEHLDERGWEEANAICREAVDKLMDVAKRSHSRLLRSGEKGLMGTWAMLLFESPFEEPESPGEI